MCQEVFPGGVAQNNIGTATGHVRGDGHAPQTTGFGDDPRLALVLLGVEHIVAHAVAGQDGGKFFRLLDGNRAHQDRLPQGVALLHILVDGVVFLVVGAEDPVVAILADHGAVGGNGHHAQLVDLVEFLGFGVGSSCHATELLVHAEVVLERDGRQRLVLAGDLHAFLGFHGLVQTIRPAPAFHGTAREFVHDDDFAILHHVVHVALVDGVCP